MSPELFFHPFFLGLGLGLFCAAMALWRVFTLKWELRRYKGHLSDRVELEADSLRKIKLELENLRKENERLRVHIAADKETPAGRLHRDLEIFARAEKRMIVSAPGFAPVWENAKAASDAELVEEEAGRSLPRRVFTRLFGGGPQGGSSSQEALPPNPGNGM